MQLSKLAAALILGSSLFASPAAFAADKVADKATTDKGAADKGAAPAKASAESAIKLNKPWGDLTSLTDEQRGKISAIHKKALAETNAIEKKEKDEIMALLSDAQKAELKDLGTKKKKETAAAKKADEK